MFVLLFYRSAAEYSKILRVLAVPVRMKGVNRGGKHFIRLRSVLRFPARHDILLFLLYCFIRPALRLS